MRKAVLLSLCSLAACATTEPPPHGETGRRCNAANAHQFIGEAASETIGAAILRETGSSVLRWAPPGVMLTMDYRVDRVTVRLGPTHRITEISCG